MGENGWRESPAGRALEAQLSKPETLDSLTRILERAHSVDRALKTMEAVTGQGEGLLAMATDSVDEAVQQAGRAGVDLEERLGVGLALLEKLSRPRTAKALEGLLDRIDQIEAIAGLADQAPGFVATALDSVDEGVRQAEQNGIEMERLRRSLSKASVLLARFVQDGSLATFLESGVLDSGASEVIGLFGKALGASRKAEPQRLGVFGLLGALNDSDVQRGLGFLVTFGKELGHALDQPSTGNATQ